MLGSMLEENARLNVVKGEVRNLRLGLIDLAYVRNVPPIGLIYVGVLRLIVEKDLSSHDVSQKPADSWRSGIFLCRALEAEQRVPFSSDSSPPPTFFRSRPLRMTCSCIWPSGRQAHHCAREKRDIA